MNMSRYAYAITQVELDEKIIKLAEKHNDRTDFIRADYGNQDLTWRAFHTLVSSLPACKMIKDISKVEVDGENSELIEFKTEPFPHYFAMMGGDWQWPVHMAIYWDGNDVRAYVPEKGHNYNTINKSAFGEDFNSDLKYMEKNNVEWEEGDEVPVDYEEIHEKIADRIKFV